MATMLNGAAIMDGALLLIAANESCPQPQTSEHLAAIEIMRLQHIIILQNKVDLIQENVAINQHEAIQKFIQVSSFGPFRWTVPEIRSPDLCFITLVTREPLQIMLP